MTWCCLERQVCFFAGMGCPLAECVAAAAQVPPLNLGEMERRKENLQRASSEINKIPFVHVESKHLGILTRRMPSDAGADGVDGPAVCPPIRSVRVVRCDAFRHRMLCCRGSVVDRTPYRFACCVACCFACVQPDGPDGIGNSGRKAISRHHSFVDPGVLQSQCRCNRE